MNEQAIKDAYALFKSKGYTDSIEDFKQLIASNPQALKDAHALFAERGYEDTIDDFKILMGIGGQPEPSKKKEGTVSPSAPSSLVFPTTPTKAVSESTGKKPLVLPVQDRAAVQPPVVTPPPAEIKAPTIKPKAPTPATPEVVEEDYFQGAFGNVLRGFDRVVPLGIGDFVDDMARSVSSSYKQAKAAEEADALLLRGTKATPEQIQRFIETQKSVQGLKPSKELQDYTRIYEEEGKGFWGVVKGLALNPSIIPEVITGSLVAMATNTDALTAGAATVGAGAAYGGATGAAAGGVGAIPGAIAGAAASLPYAFGLASSVVEMGTTFGEILTEELKGKEMTKENVKAILDDPEKYKSIRNKAVARGAIIGAADAFTGKLASGVGAKILSSSAARSGTGAATRGAVVKATAAGSGIEAVGGSVGEATARGAIGQEMDVSEIALEGLAELPSGIRSTVQARLAKPVYKVNGQVVSEEQVDDLINTMEPSDLAKTKIDIQNDFKGKKYKIQDKIVTNSIREQVKQANPNLDEATTEELVGLEKELRKFEGNTTQIGKDKAAQIRSQIKTIQENAVQKQTTNESVLRTEQPEVGLQEVGQGNKERQQATQETKQEEVRLTTLNPTGSVFADYSAEQIDALPLGENITTYDKTAGLNPTDKVTVYRGVPDGVNEIKSGDFVTTNEQLAKDYAGTGRVISMEVNAIDILDDSTEPLGEEYILRIQKTQEAMPIPEDLEEKGVQVESLLDAERLRSNGSRLFAFPEQDEEPVEVTSLEMLRSYAPDQLLAYPAEVSSKTQPDTETVVSALEANKKANPFKISNTGRISGANIELRVAAQDADKKPTIKQPTKVEFLPDTISLVHLARNEKDANDILKNGFDVQQVDIDSPVPGVYFSSEDWSTMDRFGRKKEDALLTEISNDGLVYFDNVSDFKFFLEENNLPSGGRTLSNQQVQVLKDKGIKGIVLREDFASQSRNEFIVVDPSIIKSVKKYAGEDITPLPPSFSDSKAIAEAYQKNKQAGTNPEFVQAVEKVIYENTQTQRDEAATGTIQPGATEAEPTGLGGPTQAAPKREQVKSSLQRIARAGLIRSAEGDKPITEQEIDAQMALTDAMARVWEKTTGKNDFYEVFFDDVSEGNLEALKEKGGALFQDVEDPKRPISRVTLAVFNEPQFKAMQGKMVAPQSISDLMKSRGKQIEKDIIAFVLGLDKYQGQKRIPFDEFRNDVEIQLMKLEPIVTSSYSDYGMDNLGDDHNYGAHETIIFNSPVDHGDYGHFRGAFHRSGIDAPIEWEVRQLPNSEQFVAIDKNMPPNVSQAELSQYVGTAGSREQVEAWVSKRSDGGGGFLNIGLFGHIRNWFNRATGVYALAELQSDYFQKNKATDLYDAEISRDEVDEYMNKNFNAPHDQKYAEIFKNEFGIGEVRIIQGENGETSFGAFEKDNPDGFIYAITRSSSYEAPPGREMNEHSTLVAIAEAARRLATGKFKDTPLYDRFFELKNQYEKERQVLRLKEEQEYIAKRREEIRNSNKGNLILDQFIASQKNHEMRIFREALKHAADKGATELWFPSPYTIALIEGYISDKGRAPYDVISGNEDYLTEGDIIDYGGTEMIVVESDNSTITVAPRDEVSVYDYDDLVVGEVDNRMDELLYDFKQQVEIIRAVTKEEADNYTENEWMSDEVRKAFDEYFEENPEEETVSWYDIEDKVRDAVEDRYRDMNDEDLVGWASAIYRVNDTLYVLENRRQIETLDQPGEYAGEAQEETFEDDLSSEQRTVVNKYKDLAKMIRKMRPDVVEVTDDNGKTWLKTEVTEADKSNPIIAFQEEGGKAKGAIDFANDNKASVYIFDGADISTLAHEMSGHLGRRVLERLAKVDEKFAKDYETAKKWAGVEDNQWTRAAEEKWARAFEKYLATGKAPSKALTNVFEKLKTWLVNIYNTIKGSSIDIELTPEIVKVFDNLLATESEQLMTADTKDATVLEKVLDFLDKAEVDLDRFSAETAGINLAVPVIKAIIKTVKALVKTGITLQEAISRAAAQNNVSESDVVDAMNYLFNQREVEAKPEGVSEMELPGYNRMMDELQGVIDRSIERGNTEEVAMQNAISYLQGSRVYESASDTQREKMVRDVRKMFGKRERPAPKPEKLFGEVKDVKQITMSEYNLLKKQLADTARGAKNAISLWRRTGAALADYLKKMQDGGHITAKQAGVILKKFSGVNLFKQESIDKFVDYMAKVFDNAAYAEKISNIRAMLPTAKKNVQTKLGVAQSLVPLMTKLFAINPTLIPDAVFEKYAALVEMMGQRKAVLQLSEYGQVLDAVEEVLNAVDEEVSRSEELAELFNAYPDKLVDEDGKIDFAGTITSMIKDGVIDEEDAKLMRKYKKNIVPMVQKEAKSEEQLQQEKEALINIIRDTEVDSDGLPMKDERNLARELARLIKTDGINGLDNTQLGNLLRVIDNINNGYLPHFAQLMVERLTAINNGTNLEKAVAEAKPLKLSTVYSKLKSLLTGKDKFTELIRRNPLYYIDQVFGNFNTRDIYDAVFEKAAEGQAMFKRAVTELTNKLDAAEEAVAKSFKFDSNKLTMSKFKMMTFMVQLENDSNPDSDKVNSAAKYLKKTIEHIKNGKTSFGERDAEMLQQILDDYSNSEGEIDNEKLYNSFNKAEKKAIKTVQEINEAIRDKAVYTASVIRGDSIHPLNNYIHLNVLHEYRPEEAVSGVAFVDAYNNSLRPSTKAKSLITRTGKVSPLNFDLFASANRGAKFVLMDYYLTEPIRTARKTINEASAILKEDEVDNKQKRDILNAIDRAFEEATENLLTSNFTSSSFGDKVVEFVSKQGYRAVLASLPRFVAELSSNIAFVMIAAPKDFKLGVKYRDLVLSADAPNVMANVGSKQVNRIFPHDTLSGRLVDTSILNQASGVKGSRAKNDVKNKIQQIYNLSLKKYQNVVEVMADALIATPDKMVMRPMWFGAFANEFKRMSGKDVDFDKIAANDEIYMAENKEAIDAARIIADQKTVLTGAADNAFMGVLKGTPKPNQKPLLRAFNMFNNFMTNFLVYEYMTARTGIMAAMGNGSISRKQGVALLGAVATRMTLYTLMTNILTNGLIGLFVDDEDEDDEKTFIQKVGQAIASSVTSMMLGRDFGNATKAVINQGVEYANQEFLDFLRAGEYDPYKDAIQYTVLPPERKGKKAAFSDMLMNMMGPFGPSAKTAEFAYRKATEEPKKKQDAIERSEAERDIRLPLEVLGNLGMIPLYKDIRKIVMKEMYKGIEKTEKNPQMKIGKEDMKRYFPDMYNDIYGPSGSMYDIELMRKELRKDKEKLRREIKDEMYNYIPK